MGLGHVCKLFTFAHRANRRLLVTIIKPKNYVCACVRESVTVGGPLLGGGASCDGDFLAPGRSRASVSRINFWCACDDRRVRERRISVFFGPRPSADQAARALGSDCWLPILSVSLKARRVSPTYRLRLQKAWRQSAFAPYLACFTYI